jgi:hypothetical protein
MPDLRQLHDGLPYLFLFSYRGCDRSIGPGGAEMAQVGFLLQC